MMIGKIRKANKFRNLSPISAILIVGVVAVLVVLGGNVGYEYDLENNFICFYIQDELESNQ